MGFLECSAVRPVLPRVVPPSLTTYPDIVLDIVADDSFVDMLAAGCDAGIRYDERFEQDMIAIPTGPLIVRIRAAVDLAVDAAIAGTGVIQLFDDWLKPHLDSGVLEPVQQSWWPKFSGPFLSYSGRRYLAALANSAHDLAALECEVLAALRRGATSHA